MSRWRACAAASVKLVLTIRKNCTVIGQNGFRRGCSKNVFISAATTRLSSALFAGISTSEDTLGGRGYADRLNRRFENVLKPLVESNAVERLNYKTG